MWHHTIRLMSQNIFVMGIIPMIKSYRSLIASAFTKKDLTRMTFGDAWLVNSIKLTLKRAVKTGYLTGECKVLVIN